MLKNNGENIGYVIKVLRVAAGLKQKELAEESGIKGNYLSMIEAGKRAPSVNLLRSIAKVLNVPVSYLFWEQSSSTLSKKPKEDKLLNEIKRLLLEIEQLRLSESSNK